MTSAQPRPVAPLAPSFTRREAGITALAWGVIALVAMGLRTAAKRLSGHQLTLLDTVADLALLATWAAVTPLVLRSAVRWPVRGPRAVRHAAIHLALGTGFVVVTNLLIRIPELWTRGVAAAAVDTMLGIATYYPTAIISYCVMVAIGQSVFASPPAPDEPPPALREDLGDPSKLVLREWNRVHFIELDDIEWIEADNNHVIVHGTSRTYKSRERISDVEARLDPRRFVRVHRSALIQISRIREVQPLLRGDQAVIMQSGKVVRVARSRRRMLEDALGVPI
jgi:hypothetical protein